MRFRVYTADGGERPPVAQPLRSGMPPKYPFAQMEVGDHFFAPRDGRKDPLKGDAVQRNVSACSNGWRKRNAPSACFTTLVVSADQVLCRRIK